MSVRDSWSTPDRLFAGLHGEFEFQLDVCACRESAKVSSYYNETQNGLARDWFGRHCWMNPPYSDITPWVRKAWEESSRGGALVVALLPVDTSVSWFWDWVQGKAELRFIRGRVQFVPPAGVKSSSNPKPSMLAIYRPFGAGA